MVAVTAVWYLGSRTVPRIPVAGGQGADTSRRAQVSPTPSKYLNCSLAGSYGSVLSAGFIMVLDI